MRIEPDFFGKMKAIFTRYPVDGVKAKKQSVSVPIEERTFNVVKETEDGRKWVAFGLPIADVLRGLDGRFKDNEARRFHVIPAEAI